MSTADRPLVFDAEFADLAPEISDAQDHRAAALPEIEARQSSTITPAQFSKVVGCLSVAGDFLAAFAGVSAAAMLAQAHGGAQVKSSMALSVLAGALVVLVLKGERCYREGGSLLQIRETARALRSSMFSVLMLLPLSVLLGLQLSPPTFFVALLAVPVFLILEERLLAAAVRALHKRGIGVERVVVHAAGGTARRVVSALLDSPQLGMHPVAVICAGSTHPAEPVFALGYRGRRAIPVRPGPATPGILASCAGDVLLFASEEGSARQDADVERAAMRMGMRVVRLAPCCDHQTQITELIDADGLLLTMAADPAPPAHYALLKRAMDLLLASILIVLLAPLLLVIAVLIRMDSPGPALFTQKRVGQHGKIFEIFKFRTMHAGVARYDVSPLTTSDRRITRVGRFLRKSSLDELPQLLNVVLGEMSLVGPRPEMPFLVELHPAQHRQRLKVLPGITGLWQLSADREFRIHENIQYDLYYIRNRSLFFDAAILIHTLFFAMHGV
jgi:exopolysaccharide biosynthesis polyprenyl glycosylphosphotransferase